MTMSCAKARGVGFVVLVVLLVSSLPAQEPRRVACVGDSITEGSANADARRNSWPLILGRELEVVRPGGFRVANFGSSGATLARRGPKPYREQEVYEKSLAFEPDVVVINLGTNDAVLKTWEVVGPDFAQDLRDLVGVYRALPSRPQVWLSRLTPMFDHHPRFLECQPGRAEVDAVLDAVAAELGLEVIDLGRGLEGRPLLCPDGLHPNTAGNALIAAAVQRALVEEDALPDRSLRPRPVKGEVLGLVEKGRALRAIATGFSAGEHGIEGRGPEAFLEAGVSLAAGDFHLRARLRMLRQENSAAAFHLGDDVFGFEGARGRAFRNGPNMGGLRLLHPSELLWEREAWIDFEVVRNDGTVWFLVDGQIVDMALVSGPVARFGFSPMRSTMQVASWTVVGETRARRPAHLVARTWDLPWVDMVRQVRCEPDLGPDQVGTAMARHPDAEGRVIEILSERAPGRNVPARRSEDGGQTWSVHYELPAALEGSGHRVATLPDGRIAVSFRDLHPESPTRGDLVVWVGRFEDLAAAREGDFTARLLALEGWQPADGNRQLEVDAQGDLVARGCWRLEEGQEPRPVVLRISVADILDRVPRRAHRLPLIDLDGDAARRVVVDREKGQYLGHVTTVLLEDGRTILAVYPKGHGKGEIVSKRSTDGGRTWSDRLPTPDNWATSREVPTIHRVVDPQTGKDRLILWSGLHPARLAVSEDDGANWSPLRKVGDWGGIVVMGFVERLKDGRYLAMFHDDGRYFGAEPAAKSPVEFSLYKTFSDDGGLSWSSPEVVWRGSEVHLCEPGCLRSPDGTTLAVLLRENRRRRNSYVIFSQDEGQSFSAPRELPASLTGDRHTGRYAPDGRLFISFRDTTLESPTQGDWVGWVGRWDDIRDGCEGQYRVRLADNQHRWDTAYPGVECLPDGTIVTTTYGHWEAGESPYILSLRFSLGELDRLAKDGADR